jgi:hypothetical protein
MACFFSLVPKTRTNSMTMRRQAPPSCEAPPTSFFLSLTLIFFFTLPSILAKAGSAASGAPEGGATQFINSADLLALALLSAVTFVFWRYHRRDYASPRRIGRRI